MNYEIENEELEECSNCHEEAEELSFFGDLCPACEYALDEKGTARGDR